MGDVIGGMPHFVFVSMDELIFRQAVALAFKALKRGPSRPLAIDREDMQDRESFQACTSIMNVLPYRTLLFRGV